MRVSTMRINYLLQRRPRRRLYSASQHFLVVAGDNLPQHPQPRTSGAHREGAITREGLVEFSSSSSFGPYEDRTLSFDNNFISSRTSDNNTRTGTPTIESESETGTERAREEPITDSAEVQESIESPTEDIVSITISKHTAKPTTENARKMNSPKMPTRGDRRAPIFIGESDELPRFFDDVENVANGVGLTDRELMIWACRYTKRLTDEETWKTARCTTAGVSSDG